MSWGALIASLAANAFMDSWSSDDDASTTETTTPTPGEWSDILGYSTDAGGWPDMLAALQNPAMGTWQGMMEDLYGVYNQEIIPTDAQGNAVDLSGFTAVPSYDSTGNWVTGYTLYDTQGNVVDPSIASAVPTYDSTGNFITGYDVVDAEGNSMAATGWEFAPSAAEQEAEYQQNLQQNLLSSTEQIGQQYLDTTQALTDEYGNLITGLQRPTYNVSVGGQNLGITPQRNSMLADLATNAFQTGINQADRQQGIESGLADLTYNLGLTQSPVQQQLTTFNQLWPYMYALQSLRYGLPSSTTTGSASYNPSAAETLSNYASTYETINNLWNSINTSNGGNNGSYDLSELDNVDWSSWDLY